MNNINLHSSLCVYIIYIYIILLLIYMNRIYIYILFLYICIIMYIFMGNCLRACMVANNGARHCELSMTVLVHTIVIPYN